jgi:hypothetical protein
MVCPAATGTPIMCPKGSYRTTTGGIDNAITSTDTQLDTIYNDCTPCDAGFACPQTGLTTAPTGTTYQCDAGTFCLSGSPTTSPTDLYEGAIYDPLVDFYGICPPGYYCPQGTTEPLTCPEGKFSNSYGARDSTDKYCITCT